MTDAGIGVEVCRQLAKAGLVVVLTARDAMAAKDRADELQGEKLDVRAEHLDVTDASSVAAIAAAVGRKYGRLDVLINNAAATAVQGETPSVADLNTARASLEATLFGPWRLTQALLPLLSKSTHGRIVNVSSGAGSHGDPAFGLASGNPMGCAYAVGKAALNALTVTLANELRPMGILVNAVCPGFTATFPGGAEMGARPVADGAASVVWGAVLPDDGPTGGFFRDGRPLAW